MQQQTLTKNRKKAAHSLLIYGQSWWYKENYVIMVNNKPAATRAFCALLVDETVAQTYGHTFRHVLKANSRASMTNSFEKQ